MNIHVKFEGDAETHTFEGFYHCLRHSRFNHIVYMRVEPAARTKSVVLPELPPRLQILSCTRVSTFPSLPHTITNVYLTQGTIGKIPNLRKCRQLELLDLTDNHIQKITKPLPHGLRTLCLGFNKLRTIRQGVLPSTLASLDVQFNFLMHDPVVPRGCTILWDHAYAQEVDPHGRKRPSHGVLGETPVARGRDPPPPLLVLPRRPSKQKTVYENSENVHASSVQASVSNSVRSIIEQSKEHPAVPDYVKQVLAAITQPQTKSVDRTTAAQERGGALGRIIRWVLSFLPQAKVVPPTTWPKEEVPLTTWCEDTLVHSTHGISYGHLLQMVWTIIEHHQHRDALVDILKDELHASVGVCFTGRFSRLVNVLNGFVDDVSVGISSREQMQAKISQAVNRGDRVRQEVSAILDEFGVHDAYERSAWLDALDREEHV